jgi:hypothetical protein
MTAVHWPVTEFHWVGSIRITSRLARHRLTAAVADWRLMPGLKVTSSS